MDKDRQRAFDNYASKQTAEECNEMIKAILAKLQNEKAMSGSQRELWLEDLAQWIHHYRQRVCSKAY